MKECQRCRNPEIMYWCEDCGINSERRNCDDCGLPIPIDKDYHLNCS